MSFLLCLFLLLFGLLFVAFSCPFSHSWCVLRRVFLKKHYFISLSSCYLGFYLCFCVYKVRQPPAPFSFFSLLCGSGCGGGGGHPALDAFKHAPHTNRHTLTHIHTHTQPFLQFAFGFVFVFSCVNTDQSGNMHIYII